MPAAPSAPAAPLDLGSRRRTASGWRSWLAFVSGLTSLAYQVLWTRLLASGTGN